MRALHDDPGALSERRAQGWGAGELGAPWVRGPDRTASDHRGQPEGVTHSSAEVLGSAPSIPNYDVRSHDIVAGCGLSHRKSGDVLLPRLYAHNTSRCQLTRQPHATFVKLFHTSRFVRRLLLIP